MTTNARNSKKTQAIKPAVDAHEFASEASETVAEQIVQAEVVERSESEPAQNQAHINPIFFNRLLTLQDHQADSGKTNARSRDGIPCADY